MFFVVSRLADLLFDPGTLLVFILALGVFLMRLHKDTLARRLLFIAAIGFVVLVFVPLGQWFARPLEDRFPRPPWPIHVDGILVLAPGLDPEILQSRGLPAAQSGEARLIAAFEAWRHYAGARIVFSGGSASGSESDVARTIFEQLGLPSDRLAFESRSRNTWENITYSRALVQPKLGDTWLLVTSAIHMPRAVAVAQRLGWKMIPWPSDYASRRSNEVSSLWPALEDHLSLLRAALHEWVGLFVYRLTGRI